MIQTTSTVMKMDGFDLAKLDDTFRIADFERRVLPTSVNKIVTSLLENKMYNNIIRVITTDKQGVYSVIDGQHRIAALKILYQSYEIKKYNLILEIWDNEANARDVYLSINSGRAVNIRDFTKALDTGSVNFFNELRETLGHYRTKTKFAYYDAIIMMQYAKDGLTSKVPTHEIQNIIDGYGSKEYECIKRTVDSIYTHNTTLPSLHQSKAAILRNLAKIQYDYDLDTIQLYEIGKDIMEHDLARSIMQNQTSQIAAIRMIRDIIMKDIISKYVKVV